MQKSSALPKMSGAVRPMLMSDPMLMSEPMLMLAGKRSAEENLPSQQASSCTPTQQQQRTRLASSRLRSALASLIPCTLPTATDVLDDEEASAAVPGPMIDFWDIDGVASVEDDSRPSSPVRLLGQIDDDG